MNLSIEKFKDYVDDEFSLEQLEALADVINDRLVILKTAVDKANYKPIKGFSIKEEAYIYESLRDWFKKEKWVRITTSGNIAGPCGTSKNKKNPDRCLPAAKARSLTKAQRAATARKKKKAGAKGQTVVKNTKKATVRKETKGAPPGHYFTASGNLVKGRLTQAAREKGARLSDPKDKQRSKVPPVSQYNNEAQLKEMNYSIYTDPEHFDICPGAEALRKELIDGGKTPEELGEWTFKHDQLFKLEKAVLKANKADETHIKEAEKLREEIIHLSRDLGIEADKVHYLKGHVDKIKEVAKEVDETADPQDGKAAPYGSGYKPVKELTKGDIKNLIVGTIAELKNENPNFKILKKGPYYRYLPTDDLTTDLRDIGTHGRQRSKDNLAVIKTAEELLDILDDMHMEDPERAIAFADQNNDIIKFLGTNETLMEKDDRCTRIAKRKYDTWPSAYASGAVVRCRRGEIWKGQK